MRGTLFAGVNLIGDALETTQTVREWKRNHPKEPILYVAQDEEKVRVLLKNPFIDRVKFVQDWDRLRTLRGYGDFTKKHLFDVGKAWDYGIDRKMHMSQAYAALAGVDAGSLLPVLRLVDAEKIGAKQFIPEGRFVVICPHSVSSSVDNNDRGGNKLWGDSNWRKLVPIIQEMGFTVVSLGASQDPKFNIDGLIERHGLPIRTSCAVMDAADYVVTLDSGTAHIAAALNKNLVEIYPNCLPPEWVFPHVSHCRVLYNYPPDIPVKLVAEALDELIGEVEGRPEKAKKTKEPILMPFIHVADNEKLGDGEGFEDCNDGAPKGPRNNEEDIDEDADENTDEENDG